MRNPSVTKGKLAFAAVLLLLSLAVTVGSLVLPVTTPEPQPPPAGQMWIGIAPTVDVECGTPLNAQDPSWPAQFRDRVDPQNESVQQDCSDARSSRWMMLIGFIALDVLIILLVAFALRRRPTPATS